MAVKREAEKEILKLMLQDVPTEEIAKRLNYSVGTIRKVFEELREKYNANTKVGLASAYLREEIQQVSAQLNDIIEITGGSGQIATKPKTISRMGKRQFKPKKRKNKIHNKNCAKRRNGMDSNAVFSFEKIVVKLPLLFQKISSNLELLSGYRNRANLPR